MNSTAGMPRCRLPLRHKGYRQARCVTTLGPVRFRRRFRCDACGHECYPDDGHLRFLGPAVSWPLAEVVSRLAARLPLVGREDGVRQFTRPHFRPGRTLLEDVRDRGHVNLLRRAALAHGERTAAR